jgi:hypothetical protein
VEEAVTDDGVARSLRASNPLAVDDPAFDASAEEDCDDAKDGSGCETNARNVT